MYLNVDRLSRRTLLKGAGLGVGLAALALLQACTGGAPAPPSPTSSSSAAPTTVPQPTAAPTAAPTATTQPAAAPTAAPAGSPTAAQAAATPASAGTPARPLSGTVTVNLLALYTNPGGWTAVANDYMAMFPNVKVVVDLKPTVAGYQEWLHAQFASGTPQPSLVSGNYAGDLFPGGRFVDFLLYWDKTSPYTDQPWKAGFDPGALGDPDPATNGVYLLNTENYQGVWFYNKDAFQKAGLTKPPETFDELLQDGTALNKAGYIPFAIEGDQAGFGRRINWIEQTYYDQFSRSIINLVRAQPNDWDYRKEVDDVWKYDPTDPLNDDPNKVTVNQVRLLQAIRDHKIRVDSPEVKEMRENLHKLLGPLTEPGWFGTSDAYPLFVTQKAAMYLDVTSVFFRLDKDVAKLGNGAKPFPFGAFNFPSMTTPSVQAPARGREGALGFYGVPKKTQQQNDLELDFLMYFSSPKGYQSYLQASLDPSNSQGFINGIPTIRNITLPDQLLQAFKAIPRTGAPWAISTSPANRLTCGWQGGSIQQAWLDLAQQYFSDKITIDDFQKGYQDAMDKGFPQVLKQNNLTDADLNAPEKRPARR